MESNWAVATENKRQILLDLVILLRENLFCRFESLFASKPTNQDTHWGSMLFLGYNAKLHGWGVGLRNDDASSSQITSPSLKSSRHGTSLVVQWLRPCASTAEGTVPTLVGELRSCMRQRWGQKIEGKQKSPGQPKWTNRGGPPDVWIVKIKSKQQVHRETVICGFLK